MTVDEGDRRPFLRLSVRTLAWAPLLASVALALVCTAFLVVLPPGAQDTMALLAAVVLGCGVAAAVDDPPAELTAVVPARARARLGLRTLLASMVTGTGLLLELSVLQAAGAHIDRSELVVSAYLCLGLVGLAAAAVASRWRLGLSGVTAAASVLGGWLVLRSVLPGQLVQAMPDVGPSTGVLMVLCGAGLMLVWATRDPAARR